MENKKQKSFWDAMPQKYERLMLIVSISSLVIIVLSVIFMNNWYLIVLPVAGFMLGIMIMNLYFQLMFEKEELLIQPPGPK